MNYIKPQLKITLFQTEGIEAAAQASDPTAASDFRGTISYNELIKDNQTVNLEKKDWFAFNE